MNAYAFTLMLPAPIVQQVLSSVVLTHLYIYISARASTDTGSERLGGCRMGAPASQWKCDHSVVLRSEGKKVQKDNALRRALPGLCVLAVIRIPLSAKGIDKGAIKNRMLVPKGIV